MKKFAETFLSGLTLTVIGRAVDVDQDLIEKSYELYAKPGFDKLRGEDLVFACIAYKENAWL